MNAQLPMPVSAPFTAAQKTTIRNLVRRAARAEIIPRFRKLDLGDISEKTGPLDLVTDADVGAEAMITRGLQIAFPNAVVIGEEAVSKDETLLEKIADAELSFLVDPVDGTWNFAKGLPLYGTIIAACRFGRPVYGFIFDPMGDDVVEADLDTPSRQIFPGGRKQALKTAGPKVRSAMMGYMGISQLNPEAKALVGSKLPEVALLSTLRCAAHEYRLLAQGNVDFVLGTRMTPWDHAAGVLICQKAGGYAAMLDGREYTAMEQGYLLCASSEAVWKDVADLFNAMLPSKNTDAQKAEAPEQDDAKT